MRFPCHPQAPDRPALLAEAGGRQVDAPSSARAYPSISPNTESST